MTGSSLGDLTELHLTEAERGDEAVGGEEEPF